MKPRFPTYSMSLLQNAKDIFRDLRATTPNWFLSAEGEVAFRAAKTPAQRVAYFYRYLSVSKSDYAEEDRIKIAVLMAYGVWDSQLPYAKYPDILQEGKNPFIAEFLHGKHPWDEPKVLPWLRVLYGQEVTSEHLLNTDAQTEPDLWRFSRAILWLFQSDEQAEKSLPKPYPLCDILDGVDLSCLPLTQIRSILN